MKITRSNPTLKLFLIFGLAMTVAWFGLSAQQSAPQPTPTPKPLPPGPIPAAAPDKAQWLVTYRDSAPSILQAPPKDPKKESGQTAAATNTPPPSNFDRQILITKTAPIYHEQEASVNSADRWFLPDMAIAVPRGGAPSISHSSRQGGRLADFPDFFWISRKTYIGDRQVLGRDCFIFQGNMTKESDEAPMIAMAAIDQKTLLPLVIEYDGHVQTYEYRAAPTSQLVLPPALRPIADAFQQSMQKANTMPAAP